VSSCVTRNVHVADIPGVTTRPSFSRSYRSILSSSLNFVFSITLVDLLLDHHCRFRVRFFFFVFSRTCLKKMNKFNYTVSFNSTLSIIRKTQNLFLCSHPTRLSPFLVRDRLGVRRLSVRTSPWSFGDNGFHIVLRYSCQHSY